MWEAALSSMRSCSQSPRSGTARPRASCTSVPMFGSAVSLTTMAAVLCITIT